VILALGIAAPDASVTIPVMVPRLVCAGRGSGAMAAEARKNASPAKARRVVGLNLIVTASFGQRSTIRNTFSTHVAGAVSNVADDTGRVLTADTRALAP
jgi:hypothetical protein